MVKKDSLWPIGPYLTAVLGILSVGFAIGAFIWAL